MNGLLGDVARHLARGFESWIAELHSLIPGSRLAWRNRPAADVTVGLSATGAFAMIEGAQRARKAWRNSEPRTDEDVLDYLGWLARNRPKTAVRLRLAFGSYFERHIEVPAAAERQLRSILALNLEQSTPFKPSDILTAHTLAPNPASKHGRIARQVIVKRKLASSAIAKIEELGLTVSSMDCAGPDGAAIPVDFLDSTVHDEPHARRWLAGVFLIAVLAASAVWIAQARRESALASLEQAVAAARIKSNEVRMAREQVVNAQKTFEAVVILKSGQLPAIEVINELTRLLPDDASLESLKLDHDTIELSGTAASAAATVTLVERSHVFKEAQLTAPVVPDAASGKERFGLRAKLRQGTPPGQPEKVSQVSP